MKNHSAGGSGGESVAGSGRYHETERHRKDGHKGAQKKLHDY